MVRPFLVLSLNTRNSETRLEDVLNDNDLMLSNILCLEETYLKHFFLCESFKLFNFISNFSKHGLMIRAKKHIVILETGHFEEDNIETTTTKLRIHEQHIAILSIFVAPCATLTNILVLKELCNIPPNGKIVIVEDFNVDMLQSNNKTKTLNDYMSNYNLHFLLNKKSKHQHHSLIMYAQP